MPKFLIVKIIGKDYHEYSYDFEVEAARSSDSFLTPLLNRPRPGTTGDDEGALVNLDEYGPKEVRTSKRFKKLKEYECAICMVPL